MEYFFSPPPQLFSTFFGLWALKLEMACLWSFLFQVRQETCVSFQRHWGCCYKIFRCDTSFVHENMEDSSPAVCPTCLCSDCKIYIHICGTLSLKLKLSISIRVCTIEPHLLKSRAGLKGPVSLRLHCIHRTAMQSRSGWSEADCLPSGISLSFTWQWRFSIRTVLECL